MTNYQALLWRNKATECAPHSEERNSRQEEPWAMGPFSSAHARHPSHHPGTLSSCTAAHKQGEKGGLVGMHWIWCASNKDRWAFRQRNSARITQKQCGNLRFCFFSVTDVYGLRDRSCCLYVDVTHGKGRLGNNWPRATLPGFVQISLVCNAGP